MVKYLISHRGNIDGPKPKLENSIEYIKKAIDLGYDVEIDIWYHNKDLWLGHDEPQYRFSEYSLYQMYEKLWIHCKNIEAMEWFSRKSLLNYFWHQGDTVTLTSKNYIWAHPGKQIIKGSIAVLPEIHNDNISKCIGICSDYIERYK